MVNFNEFCEKPVVGKGDIMAGVLADSINQFGDRITTFRLHYPRFIHSEFMTHRMFSRNASSSRAIPVSKVIEQVKEYPAMPIHWGKNKAGMQANVEIEDKDSAVNYWFDAAVGATEYSEKLNNLGLHKQVVNRLLEPFQFMNVVMSATDIDNFFWLRIHPDADPNIHELARVMYEAYKNSVPFEIYYNEWHTPYVDRLRDLETNEVIYSVDGEKVSDEDACKISASCAAQASYRKIDTSLDKALNIYDKLVEMSPIHASPFEHVATPMSEEEYLARGQAKDVLNFYNIPNSDQVMYNGNFRGWTQLRKTFSDENYTKEWKPDNG